ncbi:dynein regulatory complex protein 9 isoform X5 [Pipistrellus kuhlii]|uniref:dynein regulatory complex protein 9 isoform X5 n=1 Tax=Pipistrellus kuhlii TaxID=59472 RepID=UPI00174F188C|nr:dynein regulatory complex protein 9 isoform X5 [Pipistrellus kuhlii]
MFKISIFQPKASNLSLNPWQPEVMVSVIGEPPRIVVEEETAPEADEEVIPEIIEALSVLDVLRICAVLEDTTDQLSILNYIMPIQYERRQSNTMKKYNEMNLEEKKTENLPRVRKGTKEEPRLPEIRQGGQLASEFNKVQDLVLHSHARQSILSTETLKKIQNDRQFLSDVILETMQELQNSGTFNNLLISLSEERKNKMHFYDIIDREEKGRKRIKSLQKELHNVKKEREVEVQSRNEYIAHLKDQLQELKAKTNMENRFMKRNTELQISQTQKKCNKTEELLLEEIEKLRLKTEEENQIHMEIEIFLRREQQKLEEKLEFWMEKYDKDTETKQNELNALKAAKASDLAHLQELAKTIREYEQVIIEDRIEKEKNKKQIEQTALELKSIIKLQAWWRGIIVRNEIGGFRMPKREKADGKDSKGKGRGRNRLRIKR